jgi:outer membrane receptor protein involved in Fe transport
VLPLDAGGAPIDAPFTINDRFGRTGWLYGFHLQDEWRITERLTLNLGARWDQMVEFVTAGQISPRVNLVWRPTDTTTLHAGYARTFTPPQQELVQPGTIQQFVGTSNAPFSLENGAVRPERAHRFDVGVSQRFGPNLTLGIDAYYKDVRDLLDYGQFGNALIFTPFNYRQGKIYGVEFSGNWRSERWLVYGNLALSRSVGRDIRSAQYTFEPEELDYISRKYVRTDHDQLITGSAGAVWRATEDTRLAATMLYGNGLRRGFANSEKLSPYATFNLGLSQDFNLPDGGRWTARLDVVNLFDERYQLRDGSGIGVGAPQFGTRRGVFAGLSRAF